MEPIRQRSVLQAALLLTLAEHPDGVSTESVYDLIDQRYRFPDEWYRQIPSAAVGYDAVKHQGYADWREDPQELLIELVATEPQWRNEIRWARNDLRKLGYLDTTAPRGTWRLSEAGIRASSTVATEGLSKEEQELIKARPKRTAAKKKTTPPVPQPGAGLRSELLSKLDLITHSMPLDDLQLLLDIARSVRQRSLPRDSPGAE
jgi:Mrr restriction endonuclease-like protein